MYELKNNYTLWFHQNKDDWTIDGFKELKKINNGIEFWKIYNNWDLFGGVLHKHFFFMKNNIKPIWEDDMNRKGGCWSFKVFENQAAELWENISTLFVTNEILNNDECNGISICLKKNNYVVVKIWNENCKNNSIKLINKDILKKWGTDIIYISHNSNN